MRGRSWSSWQLLESLQYQNPLVALGEGIEITIGSDPEFLVYCGNQAVDPKLINIQGRVLSSGAVKTRAGYLSIDLVAGGELHLEKEEYLASPEGHLEGVAELLHYVPEKFGCPEGRATGVKVNPYLDEPRREGTAWGRSCGGDLHFGLKNDDNGYVKKIYSKEFKQNFIEPFTELLDSKGIKSIRGCREITNVKKAKREKPQNLRVTKNIDPGSLVAYFLSFFAGIPLYLIEPIPERVYRRTKTKYGAFGSWGIPTKWKTFEWRFPSTWLYSPNVAKAALVLGYTVAYEPLYLAFAADKETKKSRMEVYSEVIAKQGNLVRLDHNKDDEKKVLEGETPVVEENYAKAIGDIIDIVRVFELYKNYRVDIERLFDMLRRGWRWEAETDVLSNWINVAELSRLNKAAPSLPQGAVAEAMAESEIESLLETAEEER